MCHPGSTGVNPGHAGLIPAGAGARVAAPRPGPDAPCPTARAGFADCRGRRRKPAVARSFLQGADFPRRAGGAGADDFRCVGHRAALGLPVPDCLVRPMYDHDCCLPKRCLPPPEPARGLAMTPSVRRLHGETLRESHPWVTRRFRGISLLWVRHQTTEQECSGRPMAEGRLFDVRAWPRRARDSPLAAWITSRL